MAFESILWKVVVVLLAGGLAWDSAVVTPETQDTFVYRAQDGTQTIPPGP
jgi:hypothetical protein